VAAPYDPALLGLSPGDAPSLNDDRVGHCLDRLFDADRASPLTETVLHVVRTLQPTPRSVVQSDASGRDYDLAKHLDTDSRCRAGHRLIRLTP